MQQWLFVSSSGQQFTAHEPDVPALVQSGQISATTLMWREGMPQWMPAASVFPVLFSASTAVTQPLVAGYAAGAEAAAPVAGVMPTGRPVSSAGTGVSSDAAVRRFAAPLFERKGWIKLLGVMLIIGGIFSIPAFLLGLISIFSGLALMKLAGNLEKAQSTGDAAAFEEAQRHAAKFFFLQGIMVALGLAVMVLILAIALLGSGAAIFSGLKGTKNGAPLDPNSPPGIEDIRFPDSPPSPSPGR